MNDAEIETPHFQSAQCCYQFKYSRQSIYIFMGHPAYLCLSLFKFQIMKHIRSNTRLLSSIKTKQNNT